MGKVHFSMVTYTIRELFIVIFLKLSRHYRIDTIYIVHHYRI